MSGPGANPDDIPQDVWHVARSVYADLHASNLYNPEESLRQTYDEMKDALDLKSKSGIHLLITALDKRGFIRRLPNRNRAIEVIRIPITGPLQCPTYHWSDMQRAGWRFIPVSDLPQADLTPSERLDALARDAVFGNPI